MQEAENQAIESKLNEALNMDKKVIDQKGSIVVNAVSVEEAKRVNNSKSNHHRDLDQS
jgi:hypothetical protein